MKMNLTPNNVWRGAYKSVPFKIVNWHFVSGTRLFPSGNWNFYLYFRESACADFRSIWLPDKRVRIAPDCPEHITHDYYSCPLANVDFHCGITYYEKSGYSRGHRCVEAGCDYQHNYDEDCSYTVASVADDVKRAVESAYELGILKPAVNIKI
jgi:hypothetical protein